MSACFSVPHRRPTAARGCSLRLQRSRAGGTAALLSTAVYGHRAIVDTTAAAAASLSGGAAADGVAASLCSTLFAVVGVILWGQHWRGSAFALNLFKCLVGSVIFFLVVASSSGGLAGVASALRGDALLGLCTSAFIGIVLGDNAWLRSLQLLGPRRVILVDALRPFIAALAGGLIFGEAATALGLLSMSCAVAGTAMASMEDADGEEDAAAASRGAASSLAGSLSQGYFLAVLAVLFDIWGLVLTRKFGRGLGTWAIGGLRFGAAAACLALLQVGRSAMEVWQRHLGRFKPSSLETGVPEGGRWGMPAMSAHAWGRVTAGAVFVTFLSPALGNWALFKIPMGLHNTLTSLSPVLAIPLVWLLTGEAVSGQAKLGSVLAVLGAAAFCSTAQGA